MASVRALTSRFLLRKYQPVQLTSIRFFSSQLGSVELAPSEPSSPKSRRRTPRKQKPLITSDQAVTVTLEKQEHGQSGNPGKDHAGGKVSTAIEKGKRPPKKRTAPKKPSAESQTDETIQSLPEQKAQTVGDETAETQPPENETRAMKRKKKLKEKRKLHKKLKKLNEKGSVSEETVEAHDTNGPAPISSILDFGLPNPPNRDPTLASANDSILGDAPKVRGEKRNKNTLASESNAQSDSGYDLNYLFQRYQSSFDAERVRGQEVIDALVATQEKKRARREFAEAEKFRKEKLTEIDQKREHNEDSFVLGESWAKIIEEKKRHDEQVRLEEAEAVEEAKNEANITLEEWADVTAGEPAEEAAGSQPGWLDKLEMRRAEQKKEREEAQQKAEADAWSSEGRGLNTSIIFTQSVQDPSEVDMIWFNHDNYTPTRRYVRQPSLEPETILGRRIGDPNQLLSALSNGRNEYQYSLENLRLMRQGMEVAGLHERLRRTKLPFQFPAIKYEDIENIFRPRLPIGAATAYEPFPLIVPQESCVDSSQLWGALEGNSKLLCIHGDVKSSQGYHPAPSTFFTSFAQGYFGYLKPTVTITDANYKQPYPRHQTIFSFMGIPTMVLLTVPSLPHAEPIEPRNLLAQLIAEAFSCHYYNLEIMQAQAPIIGLLHYQTNLWMVLYDPVADIPYVSHPINADFDIPRSHDEIERVRLLSLLTNDAFTCAVINGIEAMRHRERQEGETDTAMDWRDAAEGLWAVLEARRMLQLEVSAKHHSFGIFMKIHKEVSQTRHDLESALRAIPSDVAGNPGTLGETSGEEVDPEARWWMTTSRPSLQKVRETLNKASRKKPSAKVSQSKPQPNNDGMGEYEYLMR
ncbi:hypothetical protein TWF281_001821 [Arthrobotrys megalospora]